MNEYQINDFYKNDFPIWLKKISLFRSNNNSPDWLIRPEDISFVTGEYKKHMTDYCEYMAIDPKVMETYNTYKSGSKKIIMKKK